MDDVLRTKVEAEAFRRLREHLIVERPDAQNIDLMELAGFCRNCLSRWMQEAAAGHGVSLTKDEAREVFYGMPYADWVSRHQTEAAPMTPLQAAGLWDDALARRNVTRLRAVCAPGIVIAGPKGDAVGVEALEEWLGRVGARFETSAVHVGTDAAVLEQMGVWTGPEGESRAPVATILRLEGGRIARVTRHADLGAALAEAGIARPA